MFSMHIKNLGNPITLFACLWCKTCNDTEWKAGWNQSLPVLNEKRWPLKYLCPAGILGFYLLREHVGVHETEKKEKKLVSWIFDNKVVTTHVFSCILCQNSTNPGGESGTLIGPSHENSRTASRGQGWSVSSKYDSVPAETLWGQCHMAEEVLDLGGLWKKKTNILH